MKGGRAEFQSLFFFLHSETRLRSIEIISKPVQCSEPHSLTDKTVVHKYVSFKRQIFNLHINNKGVSNLTVKYFLS